MKTVKIKENGMFRKLQKGRYVSDKDSFVRFAMQIPPGYLQADEL